MRDAAIEWDMDKILLMPGRALALLRFYKNREQELLEANNRYLERARAAEAALTPAPQTHVKAEPDYCFNPEDWEYTCSWDIRDGVHGYGEGLKLGEPLRICTLVKGPDKWVADVPVEWDEAGDVINTEVRWFGTEDEARAALTTEGK